MSESESKEKKSVRARRMIAEVEEALTKETAAVVASQFANYQEEFPRIFEMLITRNYRREFLEMMLQQLERVEQGAVSQHDASIKVGTILVDEIVKPQIKNGTQK
jgi:hypothetical protein